MNRKILILLAIGLTLLATGRGAQGQYVSADTYTRYELLAPDANSFRILYEVAETSPGAKFHFNIIRPGSDASDEAVYDLATGKQLKAAEGNLYRREKLLHGRQRTGLGSQLWAIAQHRRVAERLVSDCAGIAGNDPNVARWSCVGVRGQSAQ